MKPKLISAQFANNAFPCLSLPGNLYRKIAQIKIMKSVILLGCGGFIGTVLRYAVQLGVNKYSFTSFPLATFLVNIVGCLLIGILYGLATRYEWLNQELQLFLITGLCGGFTTFSTFSYENILLLQKGNYLVFFGYLFLSISLGFTLTWLGFVVAKQ